MPCPALCMWRFLLGWGSEERRWGISCSWCDTTVQDSSPRKKQVDSALWRKMVRRPGVLSWRTGDLVQEIWGVGQGVTGCLQRGYGLFAKGLRGVCRAFVGCWQRGYGVLAEGLWAVCKGVTGCLQRGYRVFAEGLRGVCRGLMGCWQRVCTLQSNSGCKGHLEVVWSSPPI